MDKTTLDQAKARVLAYCRPLWQADQVPSAVKIAKDTGLSTALVRKILQALVEDESWPIDANARMKGIL